MFEERGFCVTIPVCLRLLFLRCLEAEFINSSFALTHKVSGCLQVGVVGVSGDVSSGSLISSSRSSPLRSGSGVIICSSTSGLIDSFFLGVARE